MPEESIITCPKAPNEEIMRTTRLLAKMREHGLLISEGAGPAIRYRKADQIS